MGIFIKKIHGAEYLYFLAGDSQYFLGRKDDLENLNIQNLRKAVRIADRNFDRIFVKYIRDLLKNVRYMPDDERARYLSARIANLDSALRQLKNTR